MATKKSEAAVAPTTRQKKVANLVTLPQIKMLPETLYCFTFLSVPSFDADQMAAWEKKRDEAVAAGKQLAEMAPPYTAKVRDEDTGELGSIVMPTVLLSELDKAYPGGYVGKSFDITLHKLQGKKYSTFSIQEVTFEDVAAE